MFAQIQQHNRCTSDVPSLQLALLNHYQARIEEIKEQMKSLSAQVPTNCTDSFLTSMLKVVEVRAWAPSHVLDNMQKHSWIRCEKSIKTAHIIREDAQ